MADNTVRNIAGVALGAVVIGVAFAGVFYARKQVKSRDNADGKIKETGSDIDSEEYEKQTAADTYDEGNLTPGQKRTKARIKKLER